MAASAAGLADFSPRCSSASSANTTKAALVGGVGLPVDAVGVDLEQDGDAVPGAAGTAVAGTREL